MSFSCELNNKIQRSILEFVFTAETQRRREKKDFYPQMTQILADEDQIKNYKIFDNLSAHICVICG